MARFRYSKRYLLAPVDKSQKGECAIYRYEREDGTGNISGPIGVYPSEQHAAAVAQALTAADKRGKEKA